MKYSRLSDIFIGFSIKNGAGEGCCARAMKALGVPAWVSIDGKASTLWWKRGYLVEVGRVWRKQAIMWLFVAYFRFLRL